MTLFKGVASKYVQMATESAQARHVINQAMRIALAHRTVTCVTLPNDVQDLPMEDLPMEHGAVFSGVGYRFPQHVPEPPDLDAASEFLNQGEKVAILAGAGVKHAMAELVRVADLTGAAIAKAILAKTMVPDDRRLPTRLCGSLFSALPLWSVAAC